MALHFVVPLTQWIALFLLLVGWGALLRFRSGPLRPPGWIVALTVALVAGAFQAPLLYDTGLYHLQTILWNVSEPITLGLTNLHGRFGFNSLWLLLAGVFKLPVFQWTSAFAINTVLALFLIVGLAQPLLELKKGSEFKLSHLFCLLALSLLATSRGLMLGLLGSVSTDFPGAALTLYVAYLCLRAIEEKEEGFSSLAVAFFLSLFAATCKVSSITSLLFPIATFFLLNTSFGITERLKILRPAMIVGCLTFGLWSLRGLLLSGCLAYPEALSCSAQLPWGIGPENALSMSQVITAWAREPGVSASTVLANWDWFWRWWPGFVSQNAIRLLALFTFMGFVLFMLGKIGVRAGKRSPSNRLTWISLGFTSLSFVGVCFWFLKAPDTRFGLGSLVSFGIFCLMSGLHEGGWMDFTRRWLRPISLFLVLILTASVAYSNRRFEIAHLMMEFPRFSESNVATHVSNTGFRANIPQGGDQCWDAPLPCAPSLHPALAMRRMGMWKVLGVSH